MNDDSPLTEDDVRRMIRLLGEVVELEGDSTVKKRCLMDRLCSLIGGDAWAWSLVHMQQDLAPRQVVMLHGGFDEARLAKWAVAIEHPDMKPVTDGLVSEAICKSRGFTRKAVDFTPEDWWDSESAAFKLWQDAGFRSFLLSAWPLAGGGFSGIGIYRNADRPQFDRRECRIAHIVLPQVPWLRGDGLGGGDHRQLVVLGPRQRTVLHLMVQGWSRKNIADEIGVSEGTVHGYARSIFKHFGVHSQAELATWFTHGDGGDR